MLVDITITLTFLHSMSDHDAIQLAASHANDSQEVSTLLGSQKIDTQSPLVLHSSLFFFLPHLSPFFLSLISIVDKRLLVLDLLSVHLVRNINGSTIISYHPTLNIPATTARFLHERIRFAGAFKPIINFHSLIQLPGQSVYWQSMFQKSQDPTLVLLTFIWHAMYAWDEALENLYEHICSLVSCVIFLYFRLMHPDLQTGKPRNLNYGNATYPRTSCHQSPSSSLPLSPRSLYKTYYFHQNHT